MSWLIQPAQLEQFLKHQKNILVFDASFGTTLNGMPAELFYQTQRIAGARFFDLKQFVDTTSNLPNTLQRDPEIIANALGELGITPEHKIVFYDQVAHHSSCRAIWLMKVFGHASNQLYLLDGGFSAWERHQGKIENSEPKSISPKKYTIRWQEKYICTLEQMKKNVLTQAAFVLDARHPIRFAGGPEDRPGLRSGHIPNSISIPFSIFFEGNQFKPIEKIKHLFYQLGIHLEFPIISTCGSGMTAAIIDFILDLLEHEQHALYDGSWSEWGATHLFEGETDLSERPVATCLS